MRHWHEINDPTGLGVDQTVPPDMRVRREVYLRAINHMAERLGSTCRMVAHNDPEARYWCLVRTVSSETFNKMDDVMRYHGERDSGPYATCDELEVDAQLQAAIDAADELPLDEVVDVRVTVDYDEFRELLATSTEADYAIPPEDIVKASFLAWSGGFPPDSPEHVTVYVDYARNGTLDADVVRHILTRWMQQEAKA